MITSTIKVWISIEKKQPIKSFLYRAPRIKLSSEKVDDQKPISPAIVEKKPVEKLIHAKEEQKEVQAQNAVATDNNVTIQQPPIVLPHAVPQKSTKPEPEQPPQQPRKKLDSFTQLQRLRSKLNSSTNTTANSPYQSDQPPSIFNTRPKTVPHSVPVKDEEKEREKNTKNMGSGIAITKGDDGTCAITQDMSVYGLEHGSSTQYFSCGESKFDKSFREHMKKVKDKLDKK